MNDPRAELLRLQEQMGDSAQSNAEAGRLQQQYARAQALRNTPQAKSTGNWGGALSELGNVISRHRGAKRMNALDEPLAAAKSAVLQGRAAEKGYGLHRAVDATETQQEQFDDTLDHKQTALAQTKALAEEKARVASANRTEDQERSDAKGTGSYYINEKTGEKSRLIAGDNSSALNTPDGTPVEDPQNWRVAPKQTQEVPRSLYNNPIADKTGADSLEGMQRAHRAVTALSGINPKDAAELNSVKGKLKRLAIKTFTPEAFSAFLQEEMSNLSPETRNALAQIHAMSDAERHEMFGGALTKVEAASANEWIPAALGLNLDSTIARATNSYNRYHDGAKRADVLGGGSRFNDAAVALAVDSLPELAAAEEIAEESTAPPPVIPEGWSVEEVK